MDLGIPFGTARTVRGVTLENVRVKLLSPDPRKETVAEDVTWARKRP